MDKQVKLIHGIWSRVFVCFCAVVSKLAQFPQRFVVIFYRTKAEVTGLNNTLTIPQGNCNI